MKKIDGVFFLVDGKHSMCRKSNSKKDSTPHIKPVNQFGLVSFDTFNSKSTTFLHDNNFPPETFDKKRHL